MNRQQTSRGRRASSLTSFLLSLSGAVLFVGCGQMLVAVDPEGDSGSRPDAGRDTGQLDASDVDASEDASTVDASAVDASADASGDASDASDGAVDGGLVPGALDLGAANGFAVLAGSTVTSTGLSMIVGDIGLTPGSALVGFPPAVVVGTVHIGDLVAVAAALSLTDAFDDAAGRTDPAPVSVSGNLGGMTLAPGIYVSTSSLEISSGDLTLDAAGDASAVWIFQMPSTFTATSGRQVFLTGGARAGNVYWQVGSSATLGSTSRMVGNFMADQSIALETGARLDGRALARIGAVTLDASVIVIPTP